MIGIVGGVGPYAGLDLLRKVYDNTEAGLDQDHLDTILISMPGGILDRTEYLVGQVDTNPAFAIAEVIRRLGAAGASVAGIPCNTAHVPRIFDVLQRDLQRTGDTVQVLHMINETVAYLRDNHPDITRIGVLSTTGTYNNSAYRGPLEAAEMSVVRPPQEMQVMLIHPAIYDPVYGVKACSNPVDEHARENLEHGMVYLEKNGAQAVILGCTEIPLVYPEKRVHGMIAVDPTRVLARALIRETDPSKLLPDQPE